jgi:hypothetical protein
VVKTFSRALLIRSIVPALASIFLFTAWASDSKPLPWSFQPLLEQPLPPVNNASWPRNRIDHFILAELEKNGLAPAPEADARTLTRRLCFDLTGLPPASVISDRSSVISHPNPPTTDYRSLITELLASPRYGERWARHWLDLARYADVTESWSDAKSPAWLYRDWVIAAFNRDLPYDRFVVQQLANDLLPGSNPADNAALGFLGLSPSYWKELQLPPEIISVTVAEEWEEKMDAFGRTFLGLTLGCARCHDHKSDPVSAEDYYAIAGVFASVQLVDRPVLDEMAFAPIREARAKVKAIEGKRDALKKAKPAPADLKDQLAAFEKEIAAIREATPKYHTATAPAVMEAALFVKPKDKGEHGTKLDYVPGMARDLPLHERGDPNKPGKVVPRRFLSAFPGPDGKPRSLEKGSGRLELARALVEEAAPLSARVIVNRVWQQHFGRGLVPTPSEFGPAGEAPTHPALLDDLAARFVANGWSLKWLHREILESATWRQSSVPSAEAKARDPQNRLYSHTSPRRLDIESWRDTMLAATGELDLKAGGEPFALEDPKATRRTVYGLVKRRELDEMLRIHDFPDPIAHSSTRTETATPLQQLFSLNSPFIFARSEALAASLTGTDDAAKLQHAYQRLFQREPTSRERELGLAYLKNGGSWASYAQVLLTSNELLYLD